MTDAHILVINSQLSLTNLGTNGMETIPEEVFIVYLSFILSCNKHENMSHDRPSPWQCIKAEERTGEMVFQFCRHLSL